MQRSAFALRRMLLAICIGAYVVGMLVLIGAARESVLRPLLEVRYALFAYCATVIVCIVSMVIFARRVPVVTIDNEGSVS
jgi:multidrug transporter EmrE-like cation transporter